MERKNSETLSKPGKQNADINHEKLVKNESVKYTDSKVPSMNTVIGWENALKDIKIKWKISQLTDRGFLKVLLACDGF